MINLYGHMNNLRLKPCSLALLHFSCMLHYMTKLGAPQSVACKEGSFTLLAFPPPISPRLSPSHIQHFPHPPPSPLSLSLSLCSGLLGGHFAAIALKSQGYKQLSWYQDELLRKAEEVGRRLLPAFETTTGLPYPKVRQEGSYCQSV